MTGTRALDLDHVPVMPDEVSSMLAVRAGGLWVDGTVGAGGHAARILAESLPTGRVIGVDRDADALAETARRLADEVRRERLRLVHARYDEIDRVLREAGEAPASVDGALLDLGLSSRQLDDPARGFSFSADGPLDMRLDRSTGETAADLVNAATRDELARVLRTYGEERNAGRIAAEIVRRRADTTFARTKQLTDAVIAAFGGRERIGRIHVGTRTFQALRIAVNRELAGLEAALPRFLAALRVGGRLAVLSFHSLEDRIVKRTFREWADPCVCPPELPVCACGRKATAALLQRKGIRASGPEIRRNPRARSAVLRAVQKVAM